MGLRDYVPGESAAARPPTYCQCGLSVCLSLLSFTAFVFYGNDFGSMTSCLSSFLKVFVFLNNKLTCFTKLFYFRYFISFGNSKGLRLTLCFDIRDSNVRDALFD